MMAFSFSSLRVRLLLLVFLALMPALVLIFHNDVEQRHRAAAESKVEAMRLVGLASTGQKQLIDEAREILVGIAKAVGAVQDHRNDCHALLAAELKRHPEYVNFGVAALDGGVICSALPLSPQGANVNVTDRHYFQRVLQTRDFAVGSYQMGRITRTFTINFGYPVFSERGELQAVLFAAMELSHLVRAVVEAQLPQGAVLTIRDSTGTILFRYPEKEKWFGLSFPEVPIVKAILSHQGWGTAEAAGVDGIQRLYAFAPLSNAIDPIVYLSVGIERKIAFAKANHQMFDNLIRLGIVAFLAFAAAWVGGNLFVMNQVNALMDVTRRLATGDLGARCEDLRGSKELRELAHAFDDMALTLDQHSSQLQRAEAKYRALVERVPAITYVMSLEDPGKMIYVSPQIEIILGFAPAEWLSDSKPWSSQLHPDDRDRVLAELSQDSRNGAALQLEYRLVAKDGSLVWVRDESQIFRAFDNSSFIVQGIMRDITERKLSAEALRESEKAFRKVSRQNELILESAGEGIFGLDWKGDITFMNPAAAGMIGWEIQEIIGRSHHEIVHHTKPDGTPYPRSECPIHATFRDGNIHRASDEVFWRKNGTSFPIEYISTPIYEDGQPSGAVVCAKDISEIKRTREGLRESEEKFFSVFKYAPMMAAITVMEDGTYLDVNDKFLEASGFTREELLGRTSIEVGWLKAEERLRLIEALKKQGKVSGMEIKSYTRDGRPIDCLYHCELVTIDRVKRLLTMTLDITERKKAEDFARLRLELYEFSASHSLGELLQYSLDEVGALTGSPIGFYHFVESDQKNLSLQAWSTRTLKEFCKAEGHGLHYPIDQAGVWVDCVHKRRPVIHNDYSALSHRKGLPEGHAAVIRELVVPIVRSDRIVAILGVGNKSGDYTEEDVGMVSFLADIVWDITERKQAEEALRESEARLDLAVSSAHMGVWSWNIHENKRYFDHRVCHLLEIDPATFTGTSEEFFNAVHSDDHEAIRAALHRVATEDVLYEADYRTVWSDGSVHYLRARGRLYRDEAGQPKEINGVIWDITEIKWAEEEREKLEVRLRQAQKLEAIGTLAGGIAHDFNNILAAIMGYTEMALADIPVNASTHQDLEQVLTASLRARDLVQHILAFSRQGETNARQPIAVAPVIKEAFKLLRASLPTTIAIRQDISRESGTVMGDPTQLHQVVMNLCTNAAYAMRETGGELEVTLGRIELDAVSAKGYENLKQGPFVKLTVKDTGHGMDPATRERIFDPYFTTKPVGVGTGLGLAVIQGIVKRHEGAIIVHSEPVKGTVFEILLPNIEKAPKQMEAGPQPSPRGTERILFVDDEEALATLGEKMLTQLGYQVTARVNSLEAVELFRADPGAFDLVITDCTMPQMTGVDLAKTILRIRPDIPIVLCTGYSELVSEETARELGIRAYVMKPLGRRNISKVIRTVLDGITGRTV
ncbi:MAG: PAS domain S-box protein [Syntrophobacteraceae bacterium]|nr:PAS domain S-box protein [Syntrophobacteraceae bacterium]